jgi:ThiF family
MFKPIFTAGINVLWRNNKEVQFGIDPATQVRADARIAAHLIANCTGHLSIDDIVKSAESENLNTEELLVTISRLLKSKLMTTEAPQIKQRAFSDVEIEIRGAGRLGTTVAILLAHCGFSNIYVHDQNKVSLADVSAWGASRIDVGARRDHTALMIIDRIQRGVWPKMVRAAKARTTRLVILCPDQVGQSVWFAPDVTDRLVAADQPHLIAGAGSNQALVSTVLNPTHTACLRCHNARLTDLDSAWPLLSAQLIGRPKQDLAPAALLLQTATLVTDIVCEWTLQQNYAESGFWQLAWPSGDKSFSPLRTHVACGCQWNRAA